MTKLRVATTVALLCVAPLTARGYVGYDDADDPLYAWSDTLHPSDPDVPAYAYTSITGSGTSVSFSGADVSAAIPIGFSFEFFETLYDEVYLTGYGLVAFDRPAAYSGPTTIPSTSTPNNFVAGAWMYWDTWSTTASYLTRGTAPGRELVVEFRGAYWDWDLVYVNFQVVLTEDGDINVYIVDASALSWDSPRVGIENADGRRGIQAYSGSGSSLRSYAATFQSMGERPRITVLTSPLSVPEGGELEVEVEVTDRQGDLDRVSWDLDDDGEFDDAEGTAVTVSAAGLSGPDVIDIAVRAVDLAGNERIRRLAIEVTNVAPVFLNAPVTETLRGQEWTYMAEVFDPGGDTITLSAPTRPAGMAVLGTGGLRWTPRNEDVGEHPVVMIARDGAGAETALEFTLTVLANTAPGQPTIISPEMNEVVDTLRPSFLVRTPEDPEDDPLVLTFEVDTRDTFDSVDLVSSGQVPATGAETGWRPDRDLEDGRSYWWRVWAFDGQDRGHAVRGRFTIDLSGGDGGPDGGPDGGDGGPDPVGTDHGCECRAGATAARSGLLPALLLLGVALLASRSRRRA